MIGKAEGRLERTVWEEYVDRESVVFVAAPQVCEGCDRAVVGAEKG